MFLKLSRNARPRYLAVARPRLNGEVAIWNFRLPGVANSPLPDYTRVWQDLVERLPHAPFPARGNAARCSNPSSS